MVSTWAPPSYGPRVERRRENFHLRLPHTCFKLIVQLKKKNQVNSPFFFFPLLNSRIFSRKRVVVCNTDNSWASTHTHTLSLFLTFFSLFLSLIIRNRVKLGTQLDSVRDDWLSAWSSSSNSSRDFQTENNLKRDLEGGFNNNNVYFTHTIKGS